jgi:hypothetical protein
MKLLKSALVAGSWLVVSAVYAQSAPSAASNVQAQDQTAVSANTTNDEVRQAPRKADECVGPASFCTVFFGGS